MRILLYFLMLALFLTGCARETEQTDPLHAPDGINVIAFDDSETVIVTEYLSHIPYDGTDANVTELLRLLNRLTEGEITSLPEDAELPESENYVFLTVQGDGYERYLHFYRLSDTECAFLSLRNDKAGQRWEHRFTFSSAECAELIRTVDEWYDKPENRVNELTD
ncbi:MAG: hypothetical protein IJY35_00030 [Clostridia bacterium]|nr:hypothetical protein [Clostridia bacterium]